MLKKLVFMALVASALTGGRVFAGDLDGTQWKIRKKGVTGILMFWRTDTLKFENSQFTSVDCLPYGFKTSAYNSTKEGDKVAWSAMQANDKGEKMDWKGTASINMMEGTYVWTKSKGMARTYAWKGCRKTK